MRLPDLPWWLWLLVAVFVGVGVGEVARAQTPVSVVACSGAHDTCEWSTTPVSEGELQACLDIHAPGWEASTDCLEGVPYPSCWAYGIGDHDYCAVTPNSPASSTDPCYAGCFGATATACGQSVEVACRTCRPAFGPSTPRCQRCDQVVEVCFDEVIPTDPSDPNYPGDGFYNPDDPATPTDPPAPGEEPPFANCSAEQRCDCDGDGELEAPGTSCDGDRNGDGDADEGDIVQKKCEGGSCRCSAGTEEVAFGGGNACRVTDECAFHADLYGEEGNCGCGRFFLYEGSCVTGCPAGSRLEGGQCVPLEDQVTVPVPGALGFRLTHVCSPDFTFDFGDDDESAQFTFVQTSWDAALKPACEKLVSSTTRMFSPSFNPVGISCPFVWRFDLQFGGNDVNVAGTTAVCEALEQNRSTVQLIMSWIYIMLAIRLLVRVM